MFTSISCFVQFEIPSEHSGAAGQDGHGGLEVGNEFTVLFLEHGVRNEQVVFNALTDTNFSTGLVFESAKAEAKAGEAFVGLSEESARLANLEIVSVLEFTLVHSSARLSLLGLAFARTNVNVETNNISGGENPLLHILSGSFF